MRTLFVSPFKVFNLVLSSPAAVTMAAYECGTLDFPEPPYPNTIQCPEVDTLCYLKLITSQQLITCQIGCRSVSFVFKVVNLSITDMYLCQIGCGRRRFCSLPGWSWGLGNYCQGLVQIWSKQELHRNYLGEDWGLLLGDGHCHRRIAALFHG